MSNGKYKGIQKVLNSIIKDPDEFVENKSDKDIADLLDRFKKQALKNMITDTLTLGGPKKEDVDILIAAQSYKTQDKINCLTKILIALTVILVALTGILTYLTFKL